MCMYSFQIKKLGTISGVDIYVVDATKIRKTVNIDFTNWGSNEFQEYVPKNQIWIDSVINADEIQFFVQHALNVKKDMASGSSLENASINANKKEIIQRNRLYKPNGEVKLKPLLQASKLKVFSVDGFAVRNNYDIEYAMGGHDLIYSYIPQNEIWLEDTYKDADEWPFIFLHELFERNHMQDHEQYTLAHSEANQVELDARLNPRKLKQLIRKQVEIATNGPGSN